MRTASQFGPAAELLLERLADTPARNGPSAQAAIDRMHLAGDTVYAVYFHPPAFFSDDDFIRLGTIGAVKTELERLRAKTVARLGETKNGEEIEILESDLQDIYDEMRRVNAALKDYSPRKRLDSQVDQKKTPSELD